MKTSLFELQTAVLNAGGHIESRCTLANLQFQNHYVFTKESLEQFIKNEQVNPTQSQVASSTS
jgi:hypothetical protein